MKDDLRPVVVGFDGSLSSSAALDAAATEALSLGLPLQIVHAYVWPIFFAALANVPYRPDEWEPPPAIKAELSSTADRLATRYGGLRVEARVMPGAGGPVLVTESADAALMVVGGRGIGGIAGLLAGSVAPYVSSQAHCPVMVVRRGQSLDTLDEAVVVGVDGSPSSLAALRFAGEWCRRHGGEVHAIHAAAEHEPLAPADAWVDAWVEPIAREFPTVPVHAKAIRGAASSVLLAASRSAQLVVVGSRNHGELASLVQGSVGHDLIRRSACPVTVVHGSAAISGDAAASGDDVEDLVGGKARGVR